MKQLKKFFRQLFCRHRQADLLRWHWTHGPTGMDIAFVEAEYRCRRCGEIFYLYLYGKEAHDWAKAKEAQHD